MAFIFGHIFANHWADFHLCLIVSCYKCWCYTNY